MEYPDYLHDAHRDFPLAPEKLIITREMLSDEMKEFLRGNNLPFSKQERLTQTLLPKEGYITHIRNLKLYKSLGLTVTAIKRGIIFYQTPWMAEYIQLNTIRRINSRSKFEKDFFKLLVSFSSVITFSLSNLESIINQFSKYVYNLKFIFKKIYFNILR